MAHGLSPLGSPQLSPRPSPRLSFSSIEGVRRKVSHSDLRPPASQSSDPSTPETVIAVDGPGILPSHRSGSFSSVRSAGSSNGASSPTPGRSRSPIPKINVHVNLAQALEQAVWGSDSPEGSEASYPPASASYRGNDDDIEGGTEEDVYVTPEALSSFGYVRVPSTGLLPWPGPTAETASATRNLLQETHVKLDCETPDSQPNLSTSHLLAIFSMGAPPETLRACYQLRSRGISPMPKLLDRPTDKTWRRYLGSPKHYATYLSFFTERVTTIGAAQAVERYLFGDPASQMLCRSLSAHNLLALSLIGHGVEFELEAVVAQGLAMAAVSSPRCAPLFPTAWPPSKGGWMRSPLISPIRGFIQPSFVASVKKLPRPIPRHPRKGLSAFTIIASMQGSADLAAGQACSPHDASTMDATVRNRAEEIVTWCDEWIVDEDAGWDEVVEKAEELIWIATVLYAATAPAASHERLDPALGDVLCSVMALPPLLEIISGSSRACLLRSVFVMLVTTWVSRGRPQLRVNEWLSRVAATPRAPHDPPHLPGGMVIGAAEARRAEKGKGRASNGLPHPTSVLSSPAVPAAVLSPSTPPLDEGAFVNDEPTTPKAPLRPSSRASSRGVSLSDSVRSSRSSVSSSAAGSRPQSPALPHSPAFSSIHPNGHVVGPRMSSTNSWPAVLASAADHPDALVSRVVRTLAFAGTLYGTTPAGQYRCALPGSDVMDGSIFLKAAGMTLDALGWRREGDEASNWDHSMHAFNDLLSRSKTIKARSSPHHPHHSTVYPRSSGSARSSAVSIA